MTPLDKAWSPSQWIHRDLTPQEVVLNHQSVTLKGSELARRNLYCKANVRYGATAKNVFDLYTTSPNVPTGCPMVVYIHGGYWQYLSKEESAFLAPSLNASRPDGVVFVAVDYVLASEKEHEEHASMAGIYSAMQDLLRALNVVARKLNCSAIHFIGHSAGAHLLAGMCSLDYPSDQRPWLFKLVKSLWLVSGVYELEPIRHTYVNEPLQLSSAEVEACSPVRQVEKFIRNMKNSSDAVVHIVYGEFEAPTFELESLQYFHALKKAMEETTGGAGFSVPEPVKVSGRDHFDVIDDLKNNHVLEKLPKMFGEDQTATNRTKTPTGLLGITSQNCDLREVSLRDVVDASTYIFTL
ncbi:putative Kynurenine formamidase [Hypsibius exemplaris]|uniref:Kynurenine formamidase n=1 Tax=Hypsibius exemplaris TaxID=2072580 RepID=A0A1W0WRZ4_HYPEX|nr:putative Kynurenine formamidase [Hypsibius exemplaris]